MRVQQPPDPCSHLSPDCCCCALAVRPLPPQVLGTDSFYAYLNKYGLELDPQLEALVGRCAGGLLQAVASTGPARLAHHACTRQAGPCARAGGAAGSKRPRNSTVLAAPTGWPHRRPCLCCPCGAGTAASPTPSSSTATTSTWSRQKQSTSSITCCGERQRARCPAVSQSISYVILYTVAGSAPRGASRGLMGLGGESCLAAFAHARPSPGLRSGAVGCVQLGCTRLPHPTRLLVRLCPLRAAGTTTRSG